MSLNGHLVHDLLIRNYEGSRQGRKRQEVSKLHDGVTLETERKEKKVKETRKKEKKEEKKKREKEREQI